MTHPSVTTRARGGAGRGTAGPRTTAPWLTLAVLSLTTTSVAIQQTLVLPLLAQLQAAFHTSPASATWAFTATLLPGAVSTPPAGRFGDLHGERRVPVVCLVVLVIGCAVAASAGSMGTSCTS
ncbi:MFS transporter [Saccharothrix australiensis]|uniref:MFS transporter n=1 Tax=Saccharothrix australiensis TaxID=2072 RepID=A0A495W1Z9_9PSEU|nr:MFS transporter [Saccharothrix australiensis]RKT55682.1 MFS transporter [Saccharothrix australiensis]